MKKILALILSLLLLVAILFVGKDTYFFSATDKASSRTQSVIGKSTAPNQIDFLIDNSSPLKTEISKLYLNGLTVGLKELINNGKVRIVTADKISLLAQIKDLSEPKGRLVLAPEHIYFEMAELELIHNKAVPLIFFNPFGRGTCIEGNQSPYLWNFGISSNMYSESYLSYLNQKYGQLAKDLTFVMYANRDTAGAGEIRYFADVIEGLGFHVLASVSVDERETDLYKVLREMINFSPRVLFLSVTEKGGPSFFKQSHKLGFGFEMAEVLTESVPEELVRASYPDSNNFLKPSPFILSYNSDSSEAFRALFKGEVKDLTASTYRGYISSLVVGKILESEGDQALNFSKELLSLDGVQFSGPSGPLMVHARARGLIQPLHLGIFKDNTFNYFQYLGDMSPGEECH